MRITIFLPDNLGRSASEWAKRLGMNRSQFFATAAHQMIARQSEITSKLDAIYGRPSGPLPTPLRKAQAKALRRVRGGHEW